MADYMTKLGADGAGRGVNSSPDSAVKYTHDIFKRAAEQHLDIYMLCGSLGDDIRDSLYRDVTGHSFADSVREVLEAGNNVSIFIWDDTRNTPHSPDCKQLMEAARQRQDWGLLDIRSSGTREGDGKINHFIVAKSREGPRWIARIEKPHVRPTPEQIRNRQFEVPAALFFDDAEAKQYSEGLVEVFNKLSDVVSHRASTEGAAAAS